MIGGGIGTLVGSGSNGGVDIGAALRMTTGIVDSGRAVAGRGGTVGIGTAVGKGTRLVTGATSGGSVITGSPTSGEAIAGRAGTGTRVGASVAAASGVGAEPVHATNAIRANMTSGRNANLPSSERASHRPADRPQTSGGSRGAECIGRFDRSRGLSLG